jgi:hypothetical protein
MSRTMSTRLVAMLGSLLLVSFLVVTGSRAAFTGTTDNIGNSWAAGTVSLTDDDTGAAMFNASGLKPGDSLENCVVATYTGSLDSDVTLYAANLSGSLGTYLDLDIEIGGGGAFSATATQDGEVPCTGFAGASIYSGTLAGFAGASTDFASGVTTVGTWDTSTNVARTYRFLITVQDDDNAQGATAGVDFIWEAQNQ